MQMNRNETEMKTENCFQRMAMTTENCFQNADTDEQKQR